ncbi:ATP-binding protein [Desulfotignum balticum]|jgi:PAS domain S-box-containing protein|uniref:ATP-binding protein n=1 Tax=Desulfotignum balticum TaxID=115781 RepID=UPI000462CD30|nr:ATP-binding protein [Desulfotignum balticum]
MSGKPIIVTKKQPFTTYLVMRIFPLLLLVVLFFTWLAYDRNRRYHVQMETQRLHAEAVQILHSTTSRFEDIRRQAAFLADNGLIINSLVDVKMRSQVLPVFFQSLNVQGLPAGMGTLALLDYKGRVVASNRFMKDRSEVAAWIDDPREEAEYRRIDDTGLTLYRVVALYGPGSREGAVAIRLTFEETAGLVGLENFQDRVSITTGFGSQTFDFMVHEQPPEHRLIQGHIKGAQGSWVREVRVSSDERQVMSKAKRSFFMDLAVVAGGMFVLAVLLFYGVKNAVRPLGTMSAALGQIVGHDDLATRIDINGPTEIEHLSTHINQMLDRLGESTRSVEELYAAAQNQRILLDTIPVQIWYLTTDDTYGLVNQAHADFIGKHPKDIAYKNLYELFPEAIADARRAGNHEVFESARQIVFEEWVIGPTGENRLLTITKTPRLRKNGTVEFVVCSAVDITEQRQVETDLKEERARLNAIIDGTCTGTWEWNVQTGEGAVNERCIEMFGYTPEELGPISIDLWRKHVHPDDLKQVEDSTESHFKGEVPLSSSEYRIKHKEGYWVWVLDRGRVSAWTDDGQPLKMFGIFLDITDRKTTEELLKKARDEAEAANRAKSSFLSSMSHEIRTPLGAILGFGDLLARDATLSPDQTEKVNTIIRSGRHLLDLINDILDMSRIEAGRVTIQTTEFSLVNLLDEVAEMFHLQVAAKGLQWQLEKPDRIPDLVSGDDARLRQVLINLVGNAVKFTESGKITVRVSMQADLEDPDRLCLIMEVEDTGPGIDQTDLAHIFEPFEQGREIRDIGGTGLGLPISRRLVEMMGGRMTVESSKGSGSCFRFHVPVKPVAAKMKLKKTPSQIPIGLAHGTDLKRILVVDDLKVNRILLTSILTPLGFDIRTAQNGEQALEIAAAWSPHAVFMDIRMPVMDGYEAIRRLKADETTAHIPVIAITAIMFDEDKKKIFDVGSDNFIGKPFKLEEVFEVLKKVLQLEYVYADNESRDIDAGKSKTKKEHIQLTAEDMARLPDELILAIQNAVEIGDVQEMEKLRPKIQTIDAGVASKINTLVKRYDYDAILQVIPQ